MKTMTFHADKNKSGNLLHIETDGCIVNIRVGLSSVTGHQVTAIEILPDKYQGEEWDIEGNPEHSAKNVRVLRRKTGLCNCGKYPGAHVPQEKCP